EPRTPASKSPGRCNRLVACCQGRVRFRVQGGPGTFKYHGTSYQTSQDQGRTHEEVTSLRRKVQSSSPRRRARARLEPTPSTGSATGKSLTHLRAQATLIGL